MAVICLVTYDAVHGLMLSANVFFLIKCLHFWNWLLSHPELCPGSEKWKQGDFWPCSGFPLCSSSTHALPPQLSVPLSALSEVWRNKLLLLWLKLLFSSQGITRSPVFCWTMEPGSPRTHWWITQTSAGSCSDSATCRTKTSRRTGRRCRWDSSRWTHFRWTMPRLRFTEVIASALVPLFKGIQDKTYLFINIDK